MPRFEPTPAFAIGPILEALATEPVTVPTGSGWKRMRCPFHPDNRPSAQVNHHLRVFNCFSCGRTGDAIKLVREEEGLNFEDALGRCKAIAGIESEEVSGTDWSFSSLLET